VTELRTDIESAKAKMRVKFGGGREIKKLVDHLWEDETVERMTTGRYSNGNGLVVLTDRRLLFIREGMVSHVTEDFPLDKISSVSWSSGLALGKITVFASNNKTNIDNVNKLDGKEMVDLIRDRLSRPKESTPPESTAPPAQVDVVGQLKQLGELRDCGVLTPEEFETKKAELLTRL